MFVFGLNEGNILDQLIEDSVSRELIKKFDWLSNFFVYALVTRLNDFQMPVSTTSVEKSILCFFY